MPAELLFHQQKEANQLVEELMLLVTISEFLEFWLAAQFAMWNYYRANVWECLQANKTVAIVIAEAYPDRALLRRYTCWSVLQCVAVCCNVL